MPLKIVRKFQQDVEKFEKQRTYWLVFSFCISVFLVLLFLFWKELGNLHGHLQHSIGFLGIALTVVWWYWTMYLVKKLIDYQKSMIYILSDINNEVKYVKDDISVLRRQPD